MFGARAIDEHGAEGLDQAGHRVQHEPRPQVLRDGLQRVHHGRDEQQQLHADGHEQLDIAREHVHGAREEDDRNDENDLYDQQWTNPQSRYRQLRTEQREEDQEQHARDRQVEEGRSDHAERKHGSREREARHQPSALGNAPHTERETAREEAPRDQSRKSEERIGRASGADIQHPSEQERRHRQRAERCRDGPDDAHHGLPISQLVLTPGERDGEPPMAPQTGQHHGAHSMYPSSLKRASISSASTSL